MDEETGKPVSEKIKEKFSDISQGKNLDDIYAYSRSNIGETATYVALTIGLLLTLFGSFYGPPIVGFVAGLYFATEILMIVDGAVDWFNRTSMLKSVLVGSVALGLFIKAPMFFIGAGAAVILRKLVLGIEVDAEDTEKSNNTGTGESN